MKRETVISILEEYKTQAELLRDIWKDSGKSGAYPMEMYHDAAVRSYDTALKLIEKME